MPAGAPRVPRRWAVGIVQWLTLPVACAALLWALSAARSAGEHAERLRAVEVRLGVRESVDKLEDLRVRLEGLRGEIAEVKALLGLMLEERNDRRRDP